MSAAPVQPTRRAVLAAGLAAVAGTAAGCTDDPPRPAPVDPDDAVRAAAADRERALLREYDAVLLALPDLTGRLASLRAEHAEHLAALVGPPPTASPAGPSPSAAQPPAVPPPATAAAALKGLADAERTAADAHADACLAARDRGLAAVLATLSASELSHPVALA